MTELLSERISVSAIKPDLFVIPIFIRSWASPEIRNAVRPIVSSQIDFPKIFIN
jgi:hypothetical protein